jgi:hypothetical protein
MDRFPQDYVFHNLPLLLLSGFSTKSLSEPDTAGNAHNFLHQGGFRIKVDAPLVGGPVAEQLLQCFCDQDASDVPWHSQSFTSRNGRVFKIATVGRVGQRSLRPRHLARNLCADKECRSTLSLLAKHHRLPILLVFQPLMPMEARHLPSCFTHLCHP